MKWPMKKEVLAKKIVSICEQHMLTPFGLLSQVRDIEENPELYGKNDRERESYFSELFDGTGVEVEDIGPSICEYATYLMRWDSADDNEPEEEPETITLTFKRNK